MNNAMSKRKTFIAACAIGLGILSGTAPTPPP